jgi:hypothetical protein
VSGIPNPKSNTSKAWSVKHLSSQINVWVYPNSQCRFRSRPGRMGESTVRGEIEVKYSQATRAVSTDPDSFVSRQTSRSCNFYNQSYAVFRFEIIILCTRGSLSSVLKLSLCRQCRFTSSFPRKWLKCHTIINQSASIRIAGTRRQQVCASESSSRN